MTTTDLLRAHLDALAAAAQTAGDALDGAAVDLAEGTLDQLKTELLTLSGRLELVLDRLSAVVAPVCVLVTQAPGRPQRPKARATTGTGSLCRRLPWLERIAQA
jgi:hypothetical protein